MARRGWMTALTLVLAGWSSIAEAVPPAVVVTIKPLHSLVAGVMEGVAEPVLLVSGSASPHDFALRPSEARALAGAEILFRIGAGLEGFLDQPLAARSRGPEIVTAAELPGMTLWPLREGGVWGEHEGEVHGHHEAGPGRTDPHLWLDPTNARRLVAAAAEVLSRRDPANEARYRANAVALDRRLASLDRDLDMRLGPVRDIPFVVFHDAYQYFEKRYRLNAAGSLTVSPERNPGARRLREIRTLIVERGARCVFAEPQFRPALVATVIEGTGARAGVLDPLGASLPAGPEAYFLLLEEMGRSLRNCLGGPS